LIAELRGFGTVAEHDDEVMHSMSRLTKRDKLYLLGDVVFKRNRLPMIGSLPCFVEMLFGNHDKLHASAYLEHVNALHGCRHYKQWWLSHIPIHPNEMRKCIGNIHGHVHKNGDTPPITDSRYVNVDWDWHKRPIPFLSIKE